MARPEGAALTRREDWPERLHAAIAAARRTPFAWGRFDCVLWACDAVLAMTDVDLAEGWRGSYDDVASAARVVRRLGGCGLAELAAKVAVERGAREVPPRLAGRGDVATVDTPWGPALAVVVDHRLAGVSIEGLQLLPLRDAGRAWRV